MGVIKRTLMQMHQRSRSRDSELEPKIVEFKGWLCIEALKLEAPMGNMKTIRQIIRSIEKTYVRSDEYLIIKAEI
jgi:DNA-binding transcriptional regulator WhiA